MSAQHLTEELEEGTRGEETWWEFTDFGHSGHLSRDGSLHVTDEVINGATHLAASMLSLLGTALLVSESSRRGEPWKIVGFSIYGASLLFLFAASTLHHSIRGSKKIELRLRILDYIAIYPLIAGTLTPICLVFFNNTSVGWTFFAVIWSLAIAGITLTICAFEKMPKWLSMTLYISQGWLAAFMTFWLYSVIDIVGLILMVVGGIFYFIGGWVYSTEYPNPYPGIFGFHEIWHLFVMVAAACHWCMMYFYVLPWTPEEV